MFTPFAGLLCGALCGGAIMILEWMTSCLGRGPSKAIQQEELLGKKNLEFSSKKNQVWSSMDRLSKARAILLSTSLGEEAKARLMEELYSEKPQQLH